MGLRAPRHSRQGGIAPPIGRLALRAGRIARCFGLGTPPTVRSLEHDPRNRADGRH